MDGLNHSNIQPTAAGRESAARFLSLSASNLARVSPLRCDAEDAPGEAGEGLADAVRGERDFLRERLRGELKREPSEEELDDYIRRHTEGY